MQLKFKQNTNKKDWEEFKRNSSFAIVPFMILNR